MSEKKKVLITGVAGFIGSHVAQHCLDLGMEVVGLDDLSGGFLDNVPNGVIFHKGSVCYQELVDVLFEEHKFDYVYHLAAYAAEGLSHFIRKFNYETNLIGSINLINAAVKNNVKCFVFTSSIAVYGDRTPPFEETEPVEPKDPYAIAKWSVECDLRSALDMFGLNYVIFRPGNVYGPGQNIGDKYRNVIGIFMNQIMQNKQLTVFGDGEQTRAFSYIDDVAPHIAKAATMPEIYNNTFNIGGSKQYSINELIRVIIKELPHPTEASEIKYLQPRIETRHAYSNQCKAREVFGPEWTTLEVGIRKMAQWARTVGARKSQEFENIEIRKNLPEGW